jgi:hypothetical protein
MIRVTSALFVAALVRRAEIGGARAIVVRHGADEAGAIFVAVDRLDGTSDLYAPAPQSAFADDDSNATGAAGAGADRLFTLVREKTIDAEIAAAMQKETRFDSDLWLVAIEDRDGRSFVEVARV